MNAIKIVAFLKLCTNIIFVSITMICQVPRENWVSKGAPAPPPLPAIYWNKNFFHVKLEK